MARALTALAAVFLLSPPACATDPFAQALSRMEARGYQAFKRVSANLDGVAVTAVIFRREDGAAEELGVYALLGGQAALIHTYPTAGETVEFDETLGKRPFPALDGGRVLVYRSTLPALNRRTLHVLLWKKPRFRKLGAFPEGRLKDVDGDRRHEIVTRTLPLGRYFMVDCPDFYAMAQTAYQTDVLAWEGGKFVSAGDRLPGFYAERVRRGEGELKAMEPERIQKPGEYLAKALTLYYDYAAMGERRKGWERFLEFCSPPRSAPGAVKNCLLKIKKDLRERLSIPDDWP